MARMTEGERAYFGAYDPSSSEFRKFVRSQRGKFTIHDVLKNFGMEGEMFERRFDKLMRRIYPLSLIPDQYGVYKPSIIEDGGTFEAEPDTLSQP